MGIALQDQGKLDDALVAYQKALSFKPDYADAQYNMGNVLKDKGELNEATEAYQKVLSFKPDYAEAHRNLSTIKKYTKTNEHFSTVQELYRRQI